jgi:hypothetical protein
VRSFVRRSVPAALPLARRPVPILRTPDRPHPFRCKSVGNSSSLPAVKLVRNTADNGLHPSFVGMPPANESDVYRAETEQYLMVDHSRSIILPGLWYCPEEFCDGQCHEALQQCQAVLTVVASIKKDYVRSVTQTKP